MYVISQLGVISLVVRLASPSYLATPMFLGPGIEQRGL